ncbi:hypothetical protein GCM10028796_32700 [Ramlibacter monticola]
MDNFENTLRAYRQMAAGVAPVRRNPSARELAKARALVAIGLVWRHAARACWSPEQLVKGVAEAAEEWPKDALPEAGERIGSNGAGAAREEGLPSEERGAQLNLNPTPPELAWARLTLREEAKRRGMIKDDSIESDRGGAGAPQITEIQKEDQTPSSGRGETSGHSAIPVSATNAIARAWSDPGTAAQLEKWGPATLAAGFTAVPSLLLAHLERLALDPLEMLLIVHLISFWWRAGSHPFPSKETLADRIGKSPTTVRRSMQRLERLGYVERISRGHHDTNQYDLSGLVRALEKLATTCDMHHGARE